MAAFNPEIDALPVETEAAPSDSLKVNCPYEGFGSDTIE
jgi:hypothetical protein